MGRAVEEAERRHQDVNYRVALTLGADDRLIEIALERAQEAPSG